jgi:alpha-amylase
MPQLCWYFQLHQPFRLQTYDLFKVGLNHNYFTQAKVDTNKAIFQKVSQKSYQPMLALLLELLKKFPEFTFSLSCSGIFLEQAQRYQPEVITLLQKLVKTGRVELFAETYFHSLASLYSATEFAEQVSQHREILKKVFDYQPTTFRNTELIYDNSIGALVSKMGFKVIITEGVETYLDGHTVTQPFVDIHKNLKILLKHAQLSDDIAFRFSDPNWMFYPLSVEQYFSWLKWYGDDEIINLFMDFETFGEHQWEASGIFDFFTHLTQKIAQSPQYKWVTPNQLLPAYSLNKLPVYDVPKPISWADVDRDTSAWTENAFQKDCLQIVYKLESLVRKSTNRKLQNAWRKLQTSDHFYYMCTKWSADGDVHAYFSPYTSPYEAYQRFATVLADFQMWLETDLKKNNAALE